MVRPISSYCKGNARKTFVRAATAAVDRRRKRTTALIRGVSNGPNAAIVAAHRMSPRLNGKLQLAL